MGLLPPPERRGLVGIYRPAHLHRLQLIGRLQERGYSLAGIRDLLTSWTDGDELTDILGLSRRAGPPRRTRRPRHLDQLPASSRSSSLPARRPARRRRRRPLRARTATASRAHRCCSSPSTPSRPGTPRPHVLALLTAVHDAAELVATAAHTLITRPPADIEPDRLEALATRGRGLLAHGTGRLAIYTLGQRLTHDAPGRAQARPMTAANQAQQDSWNGDSGHRWVADANRRDAVLAPVADALFAAARLDPWRGRARCRLRLRDHHPRRRSGRRTRHRHRS